ncbi:MAG: tetratricopeptide repeat protein, partial [Planctomycetes bacterium]|nr:tetratricopeptide repeat protein [Planctomycetota bacterium]
ALGLNEAALDAYGQALEASPRTTRARASQARLLYQSGRDAEAVAAVGELFAKYADTVKPAERVEATVVRGLALLRGGDTSGADEAFAEALRIDAKNAEALNGKGVVCALGGRPKEAAALFVAALRANQYLIEAWTNLGVWALIAGKSSEADGMFAAAVRRDPTSVSALAGQAATLAVKGQPKEALAKVEEALRIDPEYFYGRYVRGWLRLQEGDHEGALPDFLGALQAEYHFLPSHAGAAMAFLRAASHSEAQALLETVRDFDGSRAATHITLGCVLAARGRGPEAERVFQRALELSSGPDPLLAYGRGYVAYKHGDADVKQRLVAARSLFQHGAGMQTTNPGDGEWVARCAEAVGRITDWQDTDVLFDDRFERPDGAVVGGGWIQADKTHGVAIDLAGGRVRFSGKQTKEMGLTRLEREDVRKQDFLSFEATLRPESGRCEYGVSVYFARQSETQWMGLHVGVDLGGRLRYRQAGSVEFATSRLDYSGTEPAKFERPDRNEITLRVQRRAEQRGAYAFDISVWSASKSEWIPAVKGLPVHALGSHPSYRVGIWARAPLGQSYTLWADNARVLLKRAGP